MTYQIRRQRVLAAKTEGTVGSAETLTGTDAAFNIYNPIIQCNTEMEQRQGQGGFGYLASVPAGKTGTATFRTYLEWDGTDTEPSWAETFFPACGWVKTGGTYTPRSDPPGSNVKTLTIGVYQRDSSTGTVFKSITGAMGNFVLTLPTGRPGYIDWTFQGAWQEPTNETMLTPTYPSVHVCRFAGGLAEWNDVNLCISQAVINSGNTLYMRQCPTQDSGFISCSILDRRPTITVDPEAKTLSAQNAWSSWLTNLHEYALELDVAGADGAVSDAVLSFDAPKAQLINVQEGDRSGLVTENREFQCNKNGATHDQELSIVFTAKADA